MNYEQCQIFVRREAFSQRLESKKRWNSKKLIHIIPQFLRRNRRLPKTTNTTCRNRRLLKIKAGKYLRWFKGFHKSVREAKIDVGSSPNERAVNFQRLDYQGGDEASLFPWLSSSSSQTNTPCYQSREARKKIDNENDMDYQRGDEASLFPPISASSSQTNTPCYQSREARKKIDNEKDMDYQGGDEASLFPPQSASSSQINTPCDQSREAIKKIENDMKTETYQTFAQENVTEGKPSEPLDNQKNYTGRILQHSGRFIDSTAQKSSKVIPLNSDNDEVQKAQTLAKDDHKIQLSITSTNSAEKELSAIIKPFKHTYQQEDSFIAAESEVAKAQKNVADNKQHRNNCDDKAQGPSQSIYLNYSNNELFQKEETKLQVRITDFEEKITNDRTQALEKFTQSKTFIGNNPKKVPSEQNREFTKELISENLRKVKSSLDLQHRKLTPIMKPKLDEKTKIVLSGNIKIVAANEANKYKNDRTYSYVDKNTLFAGDEYVKISIEAKQGSQVICKSRRRSEENLNLVNYESSSGILEGQRILVSDDEVSYDPKLKDEEVSCDSELEDEEVSCDPKLEDEEVSCDLKLKDEGSCNPKIEDEAITHFRCNSSGVSEVTDEQRSSEPNLTLEIFHNVCDAYLKTLTAICENFKADVQNFIKEIQN